MKKLCLQKILLCLIMGMLLLVTSCSNGGEFNNLKYGKINYYYAGLYLQVEELDEMSINDANPKFYFDFLNNNLLTTSTGYDTSAASFSLTSRNISESSDRTLYYGSTNLTFVSSSVKKIKLYALIIKDGKKEIDTTSYEEITLSKTSAYRYRVYYTYQKENYEVQLDLIFS